MISSAFRRPLISHRSIVSIVLKQDYDAFSRIVCTHRPRSFSSSLHENTVSDNSGPIASPTAPEVASFPVAATTTLDSNKENQVSLKSKEQKVGYLNRILNARVYEAAIETELQHAENLSNVSPSIDSLVFASSISCYKILHMI